MPFTHSTFALSWGLLADFCKVFVIVFTRDMTLFYLVSSNSIVQSTRARLCIPAKADPTRPRRGLLPVVCACRRARTVRRSTWFSREVGPKVVFVCSRPRWPFEDCARRSSSRAREVILAQAAFVCSPVQCSWTHPPTWIKVVSFRLLTHTNTEFLHTGTHNLKRKNASKVRKNYKERGA